MVRIFVCMHVGLTTSFGCSKVLDMIYILRLGFVRLFCFLLHPLEFTALVYGVRVAIGQHSFILYWHCLWALLAQRNGRKMKKGRSSREGCRRGSGNLRQQKAQ